jgi:hypothetical protein
VGPTFLFLLELHHLIRKRRLMAYVVPPASSPPRPTASRPAARSASSLPPLPPTPPSQDFSPGRRHTSSSPSATFLAPTGNSTLFRNGLLPVSGRLPVDGEKTSGEEAWYFWGQRNYSNSEERRELWLKSSVRSSSGSLFRLEWLPGRGYACEGLCTHVYYHHTRRASHPFASSASVPTNTPLPSATS